MEAAPAIFGLPGAHCRIWGLKLCVFARVAAIVLVCQGAVVACLGVREVEVAVPWGGRLHGFLMTSLAVLNIGTATLCHYSVIKRDDHFAFQSVWVAVVNAILGLLLAVTGPSHGVFDLWIVGEFFAASLPDTLYSMCRVFQYVGTTGFEEISALEMELSADFVPKVMLREHRLVKREEKRRRAEAKRVRQQKKAERVHEAKRELQMERDDEGEDNISQSSARSLDQPTSVLSATSRESERANETTK